ncbi:hypothetical protein EDC04DRAFT_2797350 [Pisolithus marmoratus]|nr:hypothetical protein EDC04DRAFT_2808451 [Pisolithus marmoratus]KAI5997362.1 hypothetical protein EDC04DRAFT_2797350 [Pisolithus marmoratus]
MKIPASSILSSSPSIATIRMKVSRYQMVAVIQDYFLFGYGERAYPGGFLATDELKIILAYILASYNVKFEDRSPGQPAYIGT